MIANHNFWKYSEQIYFLQYFFTKSFLLNLVSKPGFLTDFDPETFWILKSFRDLGWTNYKYKINSELYKKIKKSKFQKIG